MSLEHGCFALERRYDVSPARVFAAWAIPEQRRRWNVHGAWTVAEQTFDFRAGGEEMRRFGPAGEAVHVARTRYRDIVPDRRIVMTGTTTDRGKLTAVSVVTVQIEPAGTGSRLVLTYQAVLLDGAEVIVNREHGWGSMLDKLGATLA